MELRNGLFALLMVAVVAFVACGGDGGNGDAGNGGGEEAAEEAGGEEEGGGKIVVDGQELNDHGSEDVAGTDELELELDDFYFEPTVVRGDAGQTLTLALHNEGDALHNLSIDDQDIDLDVDAGAEEEVEVTFPESGVLVFECKYHASGGMRGALEVAG